MFGHLVRLHHARRVAPLKLACTTSFRRSWMRPRPSGATVNEVGMLNCAMDTSSPRYILIGPTQVYPECEARAWILIRRRCFSLMKKQAPLRASTSQRRPPNGWRFLQSNGLATSHVERHEHTEFCDIRIQRHTDRQTQPHTETQRHRDTVAETETPQQAQQSPNTIQNSKHNSTGFFYPSPSPICGRVRLVGRG